MSQHEDPVIALNNYLQGHPGGNISYQLSWNMTQTGPCHQVTHHATANFRVRRSAKGRHFKGHSKGTGRQSGFAIL
ncbi:hypothetical protein EI94DRAFT_1098073 [Lactarius quietus]|nr:hypothetical protein EI94DRAFT_1098073 [Lactarius quietus]